MCKQCFEENLALRAKYRTLPELSPIPSLTRVDKKSETAHVQFTCFRMGFLEHMDKWLIPILERHFVDQEPYTIVRIWWEDWFRISLEETTDAFESSALKAGVCWKFLTRIPGLSPYREGYAGRPGVFDMFVAPITIESLVKGVC